jgi:hypothetical protein
MRTAIYMLVAMAVSGLAMAGNHGAGHSGGHTVAAANTAGPVNTAGTANSLTVAASNPVATVNTTGTVNTAGDPARTPGISAPVNQPTIPPPSATTTPPPGVTTPPMQFTQQDRITNRQMTDRQMFNPGHPSANNAANFQQRIPPAMRGVGTPGKPDCSRMRGIDKSDCERRDTVRDDLPAGVTTTQPQR